MTEPTCRTCGDKRAIVEFLNSELVATENRINMITLFQLTDVTDSMRVRTLRKERKAAQVKWLGLVAARLQELAPNNTRTQA